MSPLLTLNHDHAPAILDFTGLVYDVPRSSRYSYRLSADAGFTELGRRRSLILDRVPAGRHTLELAVDNRGLSESRALLDIEIIPPLVATWPFRMAAALLVVLMLALLYLWRVRTLTRQRRELESQVNARTRELRAQKEALQATAEALVVANDKLKSLSLVDPLTGLSNRRALLEQVEAILGAEREGDHPALVIIDLDHFKRINDEHGHLAGDDVLRDFAGVLASRSGPEIIAGRWGGEEFLALLRDGAPVAARRWASELLDAVRERRVRHGTLSISYRISIGIAPAMPGDSLNSLLARADSALYASKAEGRDRLELAGPSVPVSRTPGTDVS
jgi:diguanylate cyclase (GGDEF)-like protein